MKQRRPRDYDPLDDARSTLRIMLMEAGAAGMPSYEIANELKRGSRGPPETGEQMLATREEILEHAEADQQMLATLVAGRATATSG